MENKKKIVCLPLHIVLGVYRVNYNFIVFCQLVSNCHFLKNGIFIIRPFEKKGRIMLRGMASVRPSINFFVSG